MTYALAIGACMAILQSEFLKKGYIWFYRILIALNVIGITVFIEKCFTEYYGAAEPPVRCGESHLSGLTEPLRSL